MISPSSQSNPLASIEDLMKAGQQSMKQFDDAIGKSSGSQDRNADGPFAAQLASVAWPGT